MATETRTDRGEWLPLGTTITWKGSTWMFVGTVPPRPGHTESDRLLEWYGTTNGVATYSPIGYYPTGARLVKRGDGGPILVDRRPRSIVA